VGEDVVGAGVGDRVVVGAGVGEDVVGAGVGDKVGEGVGTGVGEGVGEEVGANEGMVADITIGPEHEVDTIGCEIL
jgi:hypothetical protein